MCDGGIGSFEGGRRAFRWILLLWIHGYSLLASPLLREANQTLHFPSNPPQDGYAVVQAFPGLPFTNPVGIYTPPGETNRLFILERPGRIAVITNLAVPNRSVFLDLTSNGVTTAGECGLLGLAFHPGYSTNGYFFVFYSMSNYIGAQGTGLHQRVSRFQTLPPDANQADLATERPLITQFDQAVNHNGGDLLFGPDGYLYIAVGDEGGGGDNFGNSQRIDRNFFSGMLRVDVDGRPENLEPNPHPSLQGEQRLQYKIPQDNPWVGATSFVGRPVSPDAVRTEFYAVGLRNPWRSAFDPQTGLLYCGDVGQGAREEVDLLVKGGNYGWAYREGTIPGSRPTLLPDGTETLSPIFEYLHGTVGLDVGSSITGGRVYNGQRFPELQGFYVFGDYLSGNIWALRWDGTRTNGYRHLAVEKSVVAFGMDPRNGDLLLANFGESRIKKLVVNTSSTTNLIPSTLAETGAFADLSELVPETGVVPYAVNAPFWSDGAIKSRWFCIPDPQQSLTFNATSNWVTPEGAVWIKHFDLVTNLTTQERRRIETRFLVRNVSGIYGLTYRWDATQTNASLVDTDGFSESIPIVDSVSVVRTQQWWYPSRAACLQCHTANTGGLLGFQTAQLNGDFLYPSGIRTNQLLALAEAGYFGANPLPEVRLLPRLTSPTNTTASLEFRVRSYLEANCAACHRPGGGTPAQWNARFEASTLQAGVIRGALNDTQGDALNRVLVPGDLDHSMLLRRVMLLGPGQMPPLARFEIDLEAVHLLQAWIQSSELKARASYADWRQVYFPGAATADGEPDADPDGDGLPNQQEFLLGTHPLDPADRFDLELESTGGQRSLRFVQPMNRALDIESSQGPEDPDGWQLLIEIPEFPRYPSQAIPWQIPLPKAPAEGPQKFFRLRQRTL